MLVATIQDSKTFSWNSSLHTSALRWAKETWERHRVLVTRPCPRHSVPLGGKAILAKGFDREYLKLRVQPKKKSNTHTIQAAEETMVCSDPRGAGGYPELQGGLPAHSPYKPAMGSCNPALHSSAVQGQKSSSRCQAHCLSNYPFCEYLLLVCGKGRCSGAGHCEKSLTLGHVTNKSHCSSSLASTPSSLRSPNPFREQLNQCLTCTNSRLTAIWKGFRWGLRQGSG